MLIELTPEKFINPESIDFVITNPHPSEPGLVKVTFILRSGKDQWLFMENARWEDFKREHTHHFVVEYASIPI